MDKFQDIFPKEIEILRDAQRQEIVFESSEQEVKTAMMKTLVDYLHLKKKTLKKLQEKYPSQYSEGFCLDTIMQTAAVVTEIANRLNIKF